MAEENKQMLDPIAYRSDFNPNNIQQEYKDDPNLPWVWPLNANLNYKQYWDDSSPEWQWQKGWMNPKYEWEGVSNTYIEYNPDLTVADLDPNYLYWENARQQNRKEAGYIARRNDNIASALYNEGLTSYEDVEKFLSQQKDWTNSTNEDRLNTINSVWKRLWQIKPKEEPEEEHKAPIDENALMEDGTWKIFGKTTADTWEPIEGIDTKADANSILNSMNQARVRNVNALRAMKPTNAATSTYFGTTPYWEQAMRDIQTMDPEWYAQYQEELRKLYVQDKADSISHWAADEESKDIITSTDETIENDKRDFEERNTSDESHEWAQSILETKLASNKVATSAKEEMLNIKKDIADLNSELEDLPNKAEKAFKWDVPDYIYKAYISNNSQLLQKKIQNLENRYASLADIYKTEVANTQREAEYQLKLAEHNRAVTNDEYDRKYKNIKLMQDSVEWVDWVPYMMDPTTWTYIEMDDVTALNKYNEKVKVQSEWWQSLVWQKTWLECEWYTDKQANATAWVTMVWANWWATTAEEKVAYATNWWYIDANWNIVYWDANVSDVIPQVWDIGVMISNWKNKVSEKRWHTVYVDKVWQNENWEWMFHYTATNLWPGEDEYTVWYERTVSLSDWMNNWGVWFWNPFKQAQYNWKKDDVVYLNPMEPIVDEILSNTATTVSQRQTLSRFWNSYQKLYKAKRKWYIDALLKQWVIWWFIRDLDLDFREVERQAKNFWWDLITALVQQITSAVAKEVADEDAYNAYIEIIWVIETKLREESWARINKNEWKMDFMQYLPEASDSADRKKEKLENLEDYLRGYAKQWWITAKDYVPIFTDRNDDEERQYD